MNARKGSVFSDTLEHRSTLKPIFGHKIRQHFLILSGATIVLGWLLGSSGRGNKLFS